MVLGADGALLHVETEGEAEAPGAVWVGQDGSAELVHPTLRGPYRAPALAPDGRRITLEYAVPGEPRQILIWNRDNETLDQLTSGDSNSYEPFWSPDGAEVGFTSDRDGLPALYTRPADRSGDARLLRADPEYGLHEGSWTPEGRLVYRRGSVEAGNAGLWHAVPDLDSAAVEFWDTSSNETNPSLSPSGRWLAYSSDESGIYQVYVRPFPGPGGSTTISSSAGGNSPVWASDREILYLTEFPHRLMVATISTDPEVRVRRDSLFSWDPYSTFGWVNVFDIAPDDQQILAIELFSGTQEGGRVVYAES